MDYGMDEARTISGLETMREGGSMWLAGRYKVVRRLGEGGMGSVWLAEDTKLDNRQVAVKMLPAVLAGKKGAYRQVKQEALMAMKLSHPNIATVRGFEEDEGGSPFLVMDYIEGTGLDDILAEKGALGEAETLKLLEPVAASLDYAHAKGVVHRDVKPGNVIVDKNGTPFVLDFGIAREIQETMTRVTGKFSSGTLMYMSPEQLHGRAPKAAQDVYSFAAMAYECLSGRPPFSRGQIEYQIDHDPPEALPDTVAGPRLCRGVMAGLAKTPEERPKTCRDVLAGGKGSDGNAQSNDFSGNTRENPPSSPGRENREKEAGETVFLMSVRLKNRLQFAEMEDARIEEKIKLAQIRDLTTAGDEALRLGQEHAAWMLFDQAKKALDEWFRNVKERETRECEWRRNFDGLPPSWRVFPDDWKGKIMKWLRW